MIINNNNSYRLFMQIKWSDCAHGSACNLFCILIGQPSTNGTVLLRWNPGIIIYCFIVVSFKHTHTHTHTHMRTSTCSVEINELTIINNTFLFLVFTINSLANVLGGPGSNGLNTMLLSNGSPIHTTQLLAQTNQNNTIIIITKTTTTHQGRVPSDQTQTSKTLVLACACVNPSQTQMNRWPVNMHQLYAKEFLCSREEEAISEHTYYEERSTRTYIKDCSHTYQA